MLASNEKQKGLQSGWALAAWKQTLAQKEKPHPAVWAGPCRSRGAGCAGFREREAGSDAASQTGSPEDGQVLPSSTAAAPRLRPRFLYLDISTFRKRRKACSPDVSLQLSTSCTENMLQDHCKPVSQRF
ncbi:hypothetical protein NDU88_001507 [Pleurodeles waltl]|uniref:Uncharacterized protein n=1 Tax=Pleurodeles waltl TaxID=8319 RepID=A0AAV7WII5_PLEWA|nr:hypothetical protein NDU88_001507 [Pleurodeles waltl]